MPKYKVNGRIFNIPDNEVDLFETDFPEAQLHYQTSDGRKYSIYANERKDFLSDFPDATELGWSDTIKEQAKQADPFQPEDNLAQPMYGSLSYQDNIGKPEDNLYYPSPLNEEGRADYEPITAEERSKQEYEMLMRQLEDFNATYGNLMDTYEAYEKAARHQVNEGGFAIDTPERRYLDENSNDYHLRKQERDALNDRIKNNSYFNQMRMAESDAANEAADGIANLAAQQRAENHKLDLQYNLWNMQHQMPYSTGPSIKRALSPEALEHGNAQEDLQAAERLYRKTAEIYAAPVNNGEDILKNFAVGAGQRMDDLDFWTMGMSAIADDINARQAFQKIQDKLGSVKELGNLTDAELDELLTPSEQLLISAFMDNIQAMAARQDNTSGAFKAGQGAADSAMFMAQFLLTGGIGEAATTGTQIHKNVVNWLGRKIGGINNNIVKSIARGTAKLGVGTAESIGKALVMTPLMPHTYANIADKLTEFDDKGELMDVTDAILTGAADALIETWSESTGDFVNKVLGIPGDITKGIAKKALKNVDFSDWGRMANAPIMKILKKGGFNGFLGEMGEEFIGNAVRSVSGLEPDAFKEFTKLENLLVTAGSFAPMTIFGLGVSGAQYGLAKRKLDNAQKAFESILRNASYTEDEIRFVVDELLGSTDAHLTPEKLINNFSPLLRELQYNDRFANNKTQAFNSAVDFIWQIARYRTFDGVYHRQEEQQRNDMLAEIQEGTGREFWTTRLSENAGLDGTAYETHEVRAVEFNDGRVAYVLGGDGVNNTVVYNDGQTGFLSEEQLNEGKANGSIVSDATMGLNDYLTQQVARVRMTEEEQRMFAERNSNIGAIRAQFPIDATVELGTTEAPIQGVVRQQLPNGVIVESPAGVSMLTWEELGHTIGIETNPQTDAQMEEEAINNLEIADLQRRREREQRRAQRNTEAEAALEAEQMLDEAENEGLEKPIPMKADGTVDQTAFWNESPARWAQWKTEQRQDGGAYASTYIQNAIGILQGQIAESEAAFLAESDFDAKDALEQAISQQRERLAELQDLAMQYMPSVIPAETSAETSAEQAPAAVMAERQKFELDAEYQRRLSLAKTLAEKEMILKEYFEAISAGSMEAVVMNKKNYKQIMKDMGCDESAIEEVTNAIKEAEEEHTAVNALHVNDKIFVIAEYNYTVEQGRVSYVHERQHNITKRNPELIQRVLSLGLSRETLQKIVKTLSGTDFYDNKSDEVLADEILSSTMEIAYTFDDFSVTLSKLGIPIELINLINEINDEQRNDYSLANARRNTIQRNDRQGSSRQDVGDQGEVSGGILGEEGNGSQETGLRGAESGEAATGGEEASEEGLQVPLAEVGEEEPTDEDALTEQGFEVDEQNEDVRFSVRFLPTPEQRKGIIDSIINVTGRTRDEAERWLASELSLASIVLNDKEYLDYAPDSKYKAIKDNSDYPQGTVDFNNICRKRKDFTQMYTRLQRSYPNRIFTAEDLADIRTIMSEDGLVVACGLCYVEDRRQKLGEVADEFIKDLQDGFKAYGKKNATKRANAEKFLTLVGEDTYVPTIYDLITLEGSDRLHDEHRGIWEAFGAYNRARGQQTQNTFQGYAEYKREILTWSDAKVKKVNSLGGLRIFSYSDFEAHHLLDIIQIIIDCAARGVMIQGYTKVPEFARVVEKTGIKLNRSLIPLGDTGIVDGKLAYDPVEGIDINDPNFLESNDNVGNILIGINDEQIRMAMADPFIHFIIPYHARQAGNIRAKLNVGAWTNYIDTQNERKMSDGKRVEKNINIYTDVLNESITNDTEFVERYLEVCREKGYIPKFDQFLNRDAEGNYVYTPGYYKFLVDFKLFDEAGNILPQKPVVAQFDDAFNAQVLNDYAREERETAGAAMNSTYDKIVETLDLGEPTEEEDIRFSVKASEGAIDLVEEARRVVEREDRLAFRVISQENYEMAERIINNLAGRPYFQRLEGEYELGKLASNYAELADIIMAIDANRDYTPVGTAILGFFAENPDMHFPLLFNDAAVRKETAKAFTEELSKINDPFALYFIKDAWRIHKKALGQAGLGVKDSSTTKFNKAIDARAEEIWAAEVKGTAFNFKKQESSLDEIDGIFKQLNKDPELALLHDRVMSVARTLGVQVSFAGKRGNTAGESLGDKVSYDYKLFNSPAVADQKKCNTITHELIHSITVYAIYLRSKAPVVLSDGMIEAVDILHDVYNQIARDHAFKGEYGVSDVYEMVAELSNAQFRDKLKEKNLFQRILDALKGLLGIDTVKEDSAYQVLSDTLNYIIDNYDQAAFDAFALYASKSKSYGRMMKIEEAPLFRITPEQDKAYMDAVEAGDMETAQRMVVEAARLAMPNTKVVDENGNPKVVYHGSTAMFTIFDKSRIGSATGTADGRGFYFTTDRDYALGYKTPDFMKDLGLTGDRFTVRYGVIARHFGKDSSHDLTEEDWQKLPEALKKPFAITKLVSREKDAHKDNGYRIYTTLQNSKGEYVVVGVDVKNAGRDIEVNAIATVFGRRENAHLPLDEEVIYRSKKITPEQSSLLERPNSSQYPTEQELSDSKDSDNIDTSNESDENPSFRVTGTPTEDVVAEGVSLSPAQLASLTGDIFAALPEDSRKKITDGLNGNILGLQDAILQIPASLATKENWNDEDRQMAEAVAEQMTKAVGKEMTRPFSASEALWTLYNAVNKSTDLVSEASRALVRRNLGFDSQTLGMEEDAREGVRFRTVGDASANAQASMYNRGAANVWTRLKEVYVDMHASVEELVKAIEKRSGKKAQGFENILMTLNQQSSRGLAAMEAYEQKFLNKMFDEIRKIMDKTDFKYDDIVRYVILKHGLERNIKLAQRDAKAHYQEIYDDIIAKIKGMTPAQKRTYLTNAQLRDADAKAELATLQAVNTSALTPDQLRDHKKELAKAKKEVAEAAEHLDRAQKIATMTEQDALDELDKIFKKIEKGTDSVFKEMRKNDYSGISSMFYDTLGVDRKNYATEEEYQAALMQAKADKYDTLGDIEGAAQMEVTLFENLVNTDNLWKSINDATKETLRQQYEANMISKDQYDNLRNMFEFYVPLRGFKDNTAEDMYTYYRRPNSTGYTKPILGAEGRKTEAESPFGWIAAMAGSAIASNVKNEAKLALYYFVANRPDNGVATLSRTWFVHTPGDVDANGKKIFRPAYPPFNEDLSTDAAKQAYEDWQAQMRDLQKQGLAYEAGQRINLGNSVVNISDTNRPEHIVNVKVGGKDYTIVINGNPRAAQAINGDLNIESSAQDYGAVFGPMLRWMSSVNTSYNPEFWITNMMRDMAFTLMAVNIKEDPAYRRKFKKNYAKAFKVVSMVAKNEKGTLGNSYIENMYKDFVKYGGVTGYTQIKDSETWEKEIENYLSSNDPDSLRSGMVMRGMKSAFHVAHRFGESLEQVSRFAAFLTAVETGKSINEAINDAKEITVNFNRKGSGKMITLEEAKYLTDKNGQPLNKFEQWAAVGLSSIAPLGRRFIMFFNAAIQGLNATYQLWKKNKLRSIGWVSGYVAIGALNAVLHAMMDDDDDYLDIPQYERRNSLMIGGNGAYFKWALPQEARAFYALGDLAVESVMGRNPHQSVIGEALKISTEILPVNPSEGWKAFMPSVAVPFVELALNEDYKGAPIYNEQKWLTEEEKKRSAKWSKAYSGTGDVYIGIARGLNAVTGGDEHDAGLINLQPEKIEHLVQSAFGGTIRTADKFINTIMAAIDPEEDVTVRQFPFLNRFLTINDERYKNVHVNDVYDYYAAEAEHVLTLQKQYTKDRDADALKDLRFSDEYKWATVYSRYKKPIKKYQEAIRAADTTRERMELMKQQDELKRKMIKEISEL